MTDVLPVGRFSPSPGIIIDRTDRAVSISGQMEAWGPQANAARAATIQSSINSTWTKVFPDGYSVSCNITVTYRGPGSRPGAATQIEIDNMSGPSNVSSGLSGRAMQLNAGSRDVYTWTAAHEFGHVLGLDDRYHESLTSSVAGTFGGKRTTTATPGYEWNLMAVHGGQLEGQNIRDLAAENEPSPYWVNDDDQVRDWVNAHSQSDIAALSTQNKLRAIRVLMRGWISDDDMAAIRQILQSVSRQDDSRTIQQGINLSDFSSLGQRTTMRVWFSQMP